MLLNEIFNSEIEYIWKNNKAFFEINNTKYVVFFEKVDEGWTNVSFVADLSNWGITFNLTNTGNEFLVMSTVIRVVKDYLSSHKINKLSFSAKEKSRVSLYGRIARALAKDYEIQTEPGFEPGSQAFTLTKKHP